MEKLFQKIQPLDEKISDRLESYFSHSEIIRIISSIGNIYTIILFYILFYIFSDSIFFLQSIASFFLSTFFVFILKYTIKRDRKKNFKKGSLLEKWDPYSFPSGHISRIAAICSPFYFYPPIFLSVCILSFFVSIARISRGYHYFSDCVAGFLIGIFSGYSTLFLFSESQIKSILSSLPI